MGTLFGICIARVLSPPVPSARHHHEPVRPNKNDHEHEQHDGELHVLRRHGGRPEQGQEGEAEHPDHHYRARYQNRLHDHGAMTSLPRRPRPSLSSLTDVIMMPLRRAKGELLRTPLARSSENTPSTHSAE